MATQRGIFYFRPLDLNQTARVAREEERGRSRTTGIPGDSGAMAGIEKFGGVHRKTPTGHERTNWENGEKEMSNFTKGYSGSVEQVEVS